MKLNNAFLKMSCMAMMVFGGFDLGFAQADLEARKQSRSNAIRTFFDQSAAKGNRLGAVENMGYPDDETMARLLELGQNLDVDDDIRWQALRMHAFDLNWVNVTLAILSDPTNGGESLNSNLVQALSQRTVVMLPVQVRQSIQRIYRELLDDPRESVRHRAYFAAVSSEDPVAITKLVDGLKSGGSQSPVPIADAIELLDFAGANRHYSSIRPYLNHDNSEIQAQAARVLAEDNESQAAIVALTKDKKAPELVRIQALRGLTRADKTLPDYAIAIVEDQGESLAVREAAMGAIVSQINYMKMAENQQIRFLKAVEALASDPSLMELQNGPKSRVDDLLKYLRKSTPELRAYSIGQDQ